MKREASLDAVARPARGATLERVEEGHPKGLYVLFATEMWERFSFYSMISMFTLYMRDGREGFGWTAAEASSLYTYYITCVYASPLIGGWLGDRKLGYRRAVMIGGFFFMAGHLLLSFRSLTAVYAALACLVVGNGFFKPNVSTMVGNLYPDGSHLKDRAYNIFYMGINVGAFLAPIVAAIAQAYYGFHVAFAVAAFGMVISVWILWQFRRYVDQSERAQGVQPAAGPAPGDRQRADRIAAVPERRRILALCVVFLIVIVFWMVLYQSGSTLTYWADENTDWNVRGIVATSINGGWILVLTFPLVWFWKWLDRRGLEPSTPAKMVLGMTLTGIAFFILFAAARVGEASVTGGDPYAYKVSPVWLIGAYGVLTLGELMLSPMGLSLVSKVAPPAKRGLMTGGWFVAMSIGNGLTIIAIYWNEWLHSTFWAVLGTCALVMAVVLFLLLKPLKRAMPGV